MRQVQGETGVQTTALLLQPAAAKHDPDWDEPRQVSSAGVRPSIGQKHCNDNPIKNFLTLELGPAAEEEHHNATV